MNFAGQRQQHQQRGISLKHSSSPSVMMLRLSTRKFLACLFVLVIIFLILSLRILMRTITTTSSSSITTTNMNNGMEPNLQVLQQKHDPYYVRRQYLSRILNTTSTTTTSTTNPAFYNVCQVPPGQGEEGPAGIRGLYKIQQALPLSLPNIGSSIVSSPNNDEKTTLTQQQQQQQSQQQHQKQRVFCMVYTHSNRHADVLQAIVDTYAPHCDGFMAASNVTDKALGAWELSHFGPETYQNMWNKVQSMWFYVYQYYLFDFDWFHIGGDDMYLIPDNIRRLGAEFTATSSSSSDTTTNTTNNNNQRRHPPIGPLYLGASIPNNKNPKRRFCGGGAGYTLNRHALHVLVQRMMNGNCPAEMASDEDVRIGRCLEDAGIKCHDTNDRYGEQEVRYHHLDVQFHASWVPTRFALWRWEALQFIHGIRGNQTKLGQISNTSISFHLDKTIVRSIVPDRGIRRYHAILYQLCGPTFQNQVKQIATSTNKEEQDQLYQEWMKTPIVQPKKKNKK